MRGTQVHETSGSRVWTQNQSILVQKFEIIVLKHIVKGRGHGRVRDDSALALICTLCRSTGCAPVTLTDFSGPQMGVVHVSRSPLKSLTEMSFCAPRAIFREFPTHHNCAYRWRALIAVKFSSRHYATHRDTPIYQQPSVGSSSLLSQALDQKERGFRREDSVGPFQLGLSQPSFDKGTTKKWSELSPKGKGQSLSSVI
jgi:hypothetical protein